ncbi:MAG: amidohydrolase family protein [Alicyclobacillus sp.]|nr:amidohydrolase family protein [Alicyclobacillus sp.]
MGKVIDGFAHVFPRSFAEEILQRHSTDELRELVVHTQFSDLETRVRLLDKYGIDQQVVTLARPNIWMGIPKDGLEDLTRKANDAVAQVVKQFPDRFIPVGTLPYPSEEFLPELERCVFDLGMAGIQVFSNIDGLYLDAPQFRAFFAKAHELNIPIWIHPQCREEWSHEFILDKILGWPYDTALTMCRLVFAGVMEEFPNLKIITHHMGGMVPHFSDRIQSFYEARDLFPRANAQPLPRPPVTYLKQFYGDTVLNGAVHAFECGQRFFGTSHTVFATDYPFGPKKGEAWLAGCLEQVKQSSLPERDKELILGENLENLLKR